MPDERKTLRILHVENDKTDVELIRATLEYSAVVCDIQVVETEAGFRGAVDRGGFDLILADYNLPSFDGMAALAIAKELCPGIPFILVSGTVGEETAIDAVKAGATDYVLKQRLARLAPAVRRAMEEVEGRSKLTAIRTALLQSEERYRNLVQSIPDIIYQLDLAGRFIFISDAVRDMGFEPDELIGQHFSAILHPDDVKSVSRELVLPNLSGQITGDEGAPKLFDERRTGPRMTRNLRVRMVHKENWGLKIGAVFSFGEILSTGRHDVSESGKSTSFHGTVGIIRDVTASVQAEAELQKRARVLESMNEGVNVTDVNANIIYTNPAFDVMFGYAPGELIGKHVSILNADPPEETRQIVSEVIESLNEMGFWVGEFQNVKKNGERFITRARITAVEISGETFWISVQEDVTERIRAAAEIHKKSKEMELVISMCRSVLSVGDFEEQILKICNEICSHFSLSRVVVILVNDRGDRIEGAAGTDLSREYIRSRSYPIVDAPGVEMGRIIARAVVRGRTEVCRDRSADPEYRAWREGRSKPGRRYAKEIACIPLIAYGRTFGAITISVMDGEAPLTDEMIETFETFASVISLTVFQAKEFLRIKKLQEELVQSEKMRALGQMISGVAHELNNPLTAVIGYSHLIMAGKCPADIRTDLGAIVDNAKRCSAIVQNLVSFARRRGPKHEMCDIRQALTDTLKLCQNQMAIDGIQLEVNLDATLPQTLADQNQLQQVFFNVINNALQAMSAKNLSRRRLTVTARHDGETARVSIQDTGPGIPTENLKRIFDPFFTTKDPGHGVGLGLSLCYNIVTEHGGKITAESEEGNGATFVIDIPLVQPSVIHAFEVEAPDAPPKGSGEAVLVVDDEAPAREVMERFLRGVGFSVSSAATVDEAICLLNGKKIFRAIVSDHKMPGKDGADFHQFLRESFPELVSRFVLVTGDTLNPATLDFIEKNNIRVLEKPLDMSRLAETVSAVVMT